MLIIANPLRRPVNHRPLDVALQEIVDLGFTGLEVCSPHIELCVTPELRSQFSEWVAKLGLRFVRYNSLIPEYFDSLELKSQVALIVEGLQRDIDRCVDFGIGQLLSWEGRLTGDREARFGWMLDETVRIFREACAYGEERGVELSLEVHPFSMGSDVDWLVELCDRVGCASFGVMYDSAHFAVAHPTSYVDCVIKLAHRIKHLHFCDSDLESSEVHFPLGRGKMDVPAVIQALEKVQFSGTVMIDTWLYPMPQLALKVSLDYVRKHMTHLCGVGSGRKSTHDES